MTTKPFPIEKIFGSRTRVKIITLFTTGISRPYFVREISRAIDERLNAVRRELAILQNIGMLTSYEHKRRKFYEVNYNFVLLEELSSIMRKAGPPIEDQLFKNLNHIGDVSYACASGIFTGADHSPTDLLVIGRIEEQSLKNFAQRIERQLDQEITYTPLTLDEYKYRKNFSDLFLRQIFDGPYKVLINKLGPSLQPESISEKSSASMIQP